MMAADSRSSSGTFIWPERSQKILRVGARLYGAAGSDLVLEIIMVAARGEHPTGSPQRFRDNLWEHLRERGWERESNRGGEAAGYNVQIIVAAAEGLWGIVGDGTIWQPQCNFIAIGSGQDFAYGAAMALMANSNYSDDRDAEHLLRTCCRIACEFRSDCGGEIVVEKL